MVSKGLEENVIDHAEDGGVEADADGQREDDREGKCRRLAKAAEGLEEHGGSFFEKSVGPQRKK
jgi:hypothetical protein